MPAARAEPKERRAQAPQGIGCFEAWATWYVGVAMALLGLAMMACTGYQPGLTKSADHESKPMDSRASIVLSEARLSFVVMPFAGP